MSFGMRSVEPSDSAVTTLIRHFYGRRVALNSCTPPSSAEVKNAWSYTSSPPIRLHGVVLG
jgi:hypothetical protein